MRHPWPQQRICDLRAATGLSQPDFAWALGVSVQAVRAWEQGSRQPDLESVQKLDIYAGQRAWTQGVA